MGVLADVLHQLLIEPQRLRDGTGILRNLQSMRQPCAVMISLRGKKHLGLILKAPERFGVQNPVPVPLVDRTDITLFFLAHPPF